MLHGYERGLDLALRWRLTTLTIFFATLALSVYLFVIIPKGFFPQQDVGLITATSEAAQDISFAAMKQRQEALGKIVQADPDVASVAMAIGGSGRAGNNGNLFITLKPRDERTASAQQIIARLRPKLEKVEGARLFMQAAQDVRLGGRPTRTQFEFTLQDANLDELNEWAPKILAKMQTLPELRDVATDQQSEGTTLQLKINRDTASRYGIQPQLIDDTLYDAFGQRQVTQYFTQLNSYHVILEILPELQGNLDTLNKLYIKSPLTGEQVPLATFATWTSVPVRSLSISHQGQFPAITISFNLAQGVALGQATDAVQKAMADLGAPATLNSSFQGTAQAFQQSLGTVPLLIMAALVVVYLILGILYESYIHPLTILSTLPSAGVGALAILMAFGYDFSLIALIGIILLIGIVKKNGIMMVDFAIVGRARRASVAGGIDPQGRAAALPPDHDDDDGGDARRRAADAGHRHRLGNPPAARLCDGRRPDRQPGADAVHDAGDLSLSRQALERVCGLGTIRKRRPRPRRHRARRDQASRRVTFYCRAISAFPTPSPSSFWSLCIATVTRSNRPVNSNGAS